MSDTNFRLFLYSALTLILFCCQ